MTRFHFVLAAGLLILFSTEPRDSPARGFGGMHGGGHAGGGMRGGGASHMSMSRPSMPHTSAQHRSAPHSFGGAHPNSGNFGGSRGNVGRSSPNRGGQAGMRGSGALGPGPLAGPKSNFKFPGGSSHGFTGAKKTNPFAAHSAGGKPPGGIGGKSPAAGAASKPGNLARDNKAPSRNQLDTFLGLPGDGGMHSLASHKGNAGKPGGLGDKRPGLDGPDPGLGNRPDPGLGNRPGLDRPGDGLGTDRPRPVRPGMDARGHVRHAETDLSRRGAYARASFHGHGFYNRDWYHRHRGCWYPQRWAHGTVWAAWDWAYLNGWFGWGADPIYYDYGNTVYYQDNSVYVNGENAGTTDEYYQQASDLAAAGAYDSEDSASTDGDDGEWLPLGVFAMTNDSHPKADLVLQLAVNKEGTIRGNYTATLVDHTLSVQGSVDKKTQRAAWTIGDTKDTVFETGVENLTKDEAPMLVHKGKDTTQQWTLVRLKDDDASGDASSDDTSSESAGSEDL